jgi:CheY-like chemotaxis protein
MQEQLMISDRMASIGILAAGVAHEINNPLACVIANLELSTRDLAELAQRVDGTDSLREQLRDAREAAERLRLIVRDLKVFSRAEEDQRSAVDVQRVIDSSLRMAWNEIRHRAQLVRDYQSVPMVHASESRLGQVFLNLIVNAAQAIPPGRTEHNQIRIHLRTDALGRAVTEIADTGPGMPPEVLKNLFTPFFTTKPAGVGTGLGLTICQRIISDLGGEISVQSEAGKGTVFRVCLPGGPREMDGPAPASVGVPVASRRGRILVVDDEAPLVEVVRRILRAEHEVATSQSARDALERIEAGERYDVILCDLMMPHMTGMELYTELSRVAPEQAARMVFLTGGAFTAGAREFLDRVPNQRLEKPFEPQQLRATVNDRLR